MVVRCTNSMLADHAWSVRAMQHQFVIGERVEQRGLEALDQITGQRHALAEPPASDHIAARRNVCQWDRAMCQDFTPSDRPHSERRPSRT
jgi:hypothetical protein